MKSRYIACMLVKNQQNEYLFIKQNKPGGAYPGTLHIPGGGIESGEDPMKAAIREVCEETAIKVINVQPIDFYWNIVDYKGEPTMLVFLRFTGESDGTKGYAGSDAKELVWVPASELAKQLHNPPSLHLLKRLELV